MLTFCLGILLQRFYTLGKIFANPGLQHLIPIAPNVPDSITSLVQPEWDVPATERGNLKLFVLIGQSNMSGRGSLDSPFVPKQHTSVYMFNKDYRWYPAREPLGSMALEVDWVAQDGGTGVGPGLAFAEEILSKIPEAKIGLIPCARGASSIADWQPNVSQNSLYGACLKRVMAASPYGNVAGVLISQGEDDTLDPKLFPDRVLSPDSWGIKFASLVWTLRDDLNQSLLPVIFSQLPDYSEDQRPHWTTVREQQAQVSLPNVRMIVTEDLTLEEGVHFGTESQVEIGRRFAEAYLAMEAAKEP